MFRCLGSVIRQYTCSCHTNWALKCLPYTPCTWKQLQTAWVATTCLLLLQPHNCQWNFHHKFYFLEIDVALLWALFLCLLVCACVQFKFIFDAVEFGVLVVLLKILIVGWKEEIIRENLSPYKSLIIMSKVVTFMDFSSL